MVSPASLFAVVIACVAQRALGFQHLLFWAPSEWDKVKQIEYKIDRRNEEGYNPNEDAATDGWITPSNGVGGASFAYSVAVQIGDKVTVKLTPIEGASVEDTQEIVDVRSEGKRGQTMSWNVGSVPLFAQLENVHHKDVWQTFRQKLPELSMGPMYKEQMGSLFEESQKEHDGWHVVIMMDHVPSGDVKLTYKTTEGKTRETVKKADRGGLFAAWSLDNAAGDLEMFVDGQSQVQMRIETASFVQKSFGSQESHVYILPFNSHKHSDAAWRQVVKHHDSVSHPFWNDEKSTWVGSELEQLTKDVASGTAFRSADPLVLDDAGVVADKDGKEHDDTGSGTKMAIAVSVVAMILLVSGYYCCCTVPEEEEERGCSVDSTTLSNDPPYAPSMLGEAWPQESVRELVPPASVV